MQKTNVHKNISFIHNKIFNLLLNNPKKARLYFFFISLKKFGLKLKSSFCFGRRQTRFFCFKSILLRRMTTVMRLFFSKYYVFMGLFYFQLKNYFFFFKVILFTFFLFF